jgi:hypothetical protein
MLLDCGVHRIRSKVQFTGPRHSTIIQLYLRKQGRVGKRGKNSGLRRMYQPRYIDHPGKAIGKCHPQTEARKGFDFSYTPRRPGRDRCG